MSYKKTVARMEREFKVKFPELNAAFYISKRNIYIHMVLDRCIFSYDNYAKIIAQINTFFFSKLWSKIYC